jgi:hypothetical protein
VSVHSQLARSEQENGEFVTMKNTFASCQGNLWLGNGNRQKNKNHLVWFPSRTDNRFEIFPVNAPTCGLGMDAVPNSSGVLSFAIDAARPSTVAAASGCGLEFGIFARVFTVLHLGGTSPEGAKRTQPRGKTPGKCNKDVRLVRAQENDLNNDKK